MLQIGAASLLQIGASVVTNQGSYYKLGQPLLQNRTAIKNWGNFFYKLGQVLQIRAIIKNLGNSDFILFCCLISVSKKWYIETMLIIQLAKVNNNQMNEKKKPGVSEYGPSICNWAN